ncbi:MAG: DUF1906 domain-containing protein, partial [Streptomycetaceae bacterium]|nr:DUF1906 domain-containing protein [Streptomycetaceae bacterium]
MAAATCLTTGAASAVVVRSSDTDPHDSSGTAAAARDDDNSGDGVGTSFDPFDTLRALSSRGNADDLSRLSLDDSQRQAQAPPDDRTLGDDLADGLAGDPRDTTDAPAGIASRALPATLRGVAPTTGNLNAVGAHLYKGWAFDVCSAPSLAVMRSWRHSDYGAIGVYIGGRARNCVQPNLDRKWIRSVSGMGWKILPIFVGSQSPCTTNHARRHHRIDVDDPRNQGMDEGDDAARDAARLGLARHSPIFLDMEAYRTHGKKCTKPVIAFTQGWNRTVRKHGYLPGFYSSANSGITQIEAARHAGKRDLPDLMWFARWEVDPTIYGEPRLSRSAWRPHRR